MRNKRILFLSQAAMIAAVYVVLTFSFASFSTGPVQVRLSEALTILPYFTPAAIPGLFIGCLIGNLLAGALLPDVIFGSLATLLGAFGTFFLRKYSKYFAPLPPIIANSIIVPFILRYAYGEPIPIPYLMAFIAGGEFISCGIIGLILLNTLNNYKDKIFKSF